eukprot:2630759-Pyramimonas_sp.AAC.1
MKRSRRLVSSARRAVARRTLSTSSPATIARVLFVSSLLCLRLLHRLCGCATPGCTLAERAARVDGDVGGKGAGGKGRIRQGNAKGHEEDAGVAGDSRLLPASHLEQQGASGAISELHRMSHIATNGRCNNLLPGTAKHALSAAYEVA